MRSSTHRLHRICFFLIFFLLFEIGHATGTHFYNLNKQFGISIREMNSVCSSDDGFIWVSSKFGILRIAGTHYKKYKLPYETADIISVKLVCRDSKLYAYTNNGQLFSYNTIFDSFELILNLNKKLENPYLSISNLLIDKKGGLWFATSVGIYFFENNSVTKVGAEDQSIQYAEWYNEQQFFYSSDQGVYLLNTVGKTEKLIFRNQANDSPVVSAMFYDSPLKRLWVGTLSKGLYYLSEADNFESRVDYLDFPNQPVLTLETNSDSTMLVGIDGQGVWEISKKTDKLIQIYKDNSDDPTSLVGNGVYDIYCDNNKRVWVCTYSGGVSYFDQKNSIIENIDHVVNNSRSLINSDVNSVLEDSFGNLWFATNNGISFWNTKTNKWKHLYHNIKEQTHVFLTLCEDNTGRIWAGSYSSGVYLIDSKTCCELAHYSPEDTEGAFDSNFVFDIFKDSQGNIWIGGVQGDLICYQGNLNVIKSYQNLPVDIIIELSPGKMLLGATYGLLLLDVETGVIENLAEGFLVYDITVVNNQIWFCTCGDGLIRYDIATKNILKFTEEDGLPTNFVNSITYSEGYLWIGTEEGLCRLNLKDNRISTFRSISALADVSYNQNAHFYLSSGRLIWGTNNGVMIFDPSDLQVTDTSGKIFYQDLFVSGKSIRYADNLELKSPVDSIDNLKLKYFQNNISLELLPIGESVSGSKFAWMLEGFEYKWSQATDNNVLTYTNLPSGEFCLRIRMFDSSIKKVVDERSILITIVPPLWEKWWFQSFIVLFILGIGVFLIAYYVNQLKKKHSEDKIRFFANTAHDIRTSLTLIKGPIEELNKESDLSDLGLYYLHLATEQVRRLFSVVTQLMDFQKVDVGKERLTLTLIDIVKIINNRVLMFESYAKSRDIKLIFRTNKPSCVTALDETMIEKVVDNLISNAIKYSFPNSKIEVELMCNQKKWILDIRDYGIGISKKTQHQLFKEFYRGENAINSKIGGSGLGLLLVKNYVALYGGDISCSSQENVGSTFQVVIPYREVSGDIQTVKSGVKPVFAPYFPHDIILYSEKQKERTSVTKMRILVVEDQDDLRNFLKSVLGDQFDVSLAKDGMLAWEIIQKQAPDLVVSDIMMPNMDGFGLCKKMKSTYETSHVPIILLTALSGKTQKLQGLGFGADDYLTKPFDVTLLQQRIKSIIMNRMAVREKALKLINVKNDEPILENELNDKFVKKMVEVVRANISNSEFNKDEFASAMNVSPSLLYKKVKALTDQSPTDFIKTIRLNHALELLQTHKHTITEVGELCGFSSVGYFSTVFRKHFGKSPSQALFPQPNL